MANIRTAFMLTDHAQQGIESLLQTELDSKQISKNEMKVASIRIMKSLYQAYREVEGYYLRNYK
jgi:hypothetical protein